MRTTSFLFAAAVAGAFSCSVGGPDETAPAAPPASGGKGGAGGASGSAGAGNTFQVDASFDAKDESTNCFGKDQDADGDGWFANKGDCNDCDPGVNPGAIEIIAEPDADGGVPDAVDENCDGYIDNVEGPCDFALPIHDEDPLHAAWAIELCRVAGFNPLDWGIKKASWVLADGDPAPANSTFHEGHGILPHFGTTVKVQGGDRMLALSSGAARDPSMPGYKSVGGYDKGYTSDHPFGFPKESPACPGVTTGVPHDATGLEIEMRVPSNAHGFKFDFHFYTYEWPSYVCSQYNDFFVALIDPFPQNQPDGNISFDNQGNPVSVNNAFVEACGCFGGPPCTAGGKSFTCSLGNVPLLGTGFGSDTEGSDHASTGWLMTQSPVEPGSLITVRFATYDSGDGVLDSTTLIDNWTWIAKPGTKVGTSPIPNPN